MGCSSPATSPPQQPPKVVLEDKDTKAMTIALSDLNTKTTKLSKLDFTEEFQAYEQVWGTLQADYDNLKSQASLPPYDASQVASIKNTLATVESDLQGLNKVNSQLAGKIKGIKKDMLLVQESAAFLEKTWTEYQKVPKEQKKYTQGIIADTLNSARAQIIEVEEKIKASEMQARMQNGRANGLFNSVKAYVNSLRLSE